MPLTCPAPTLWSSHQSTLGRPVTPAALRMWVGFTCTAVAAGEPGGARQAQLEPGRVWKERHKQPRRSSRQAAQTLRPMLRAQTSRRPGTHPLNVREDAGAVLQAGLAILERQPLLLQNLAHQAACSQELWRVASEQACRRAAQSPVAPSALLTDPARLAEDQELLQIGAEGGQSGSSCQPNMAVFKWGSG